MQDFFLQLELVPETRFLPFVGSFVGNFVDPIDRKLRISTKFATKLPTKVCREALLGRAYPAHSAGLQKFNSIWGRRQAHGEDTAMAVFALDFDTAAVSVHDGLADGQPQAAAALGPGASPVSAVEPFEDMREVGRSDANAGVRHD